MDSQDQRKAHAPGHDSHGVYVCHKCGWPFPNPHPSAKHRRAHKKICGTIEGYKVCLSEEQTRLNGSDDEHGSDDDHKSPGPKGLVIGNNEKGDNGISEKIHRSEDEVFSDAVADFAEGGLSQGVKERSQEESLDSGTSVGKKDPEFSVSSEHNDLYDVSQLTLEATDECQVQHPEISQGERVKEGNTLELQGQLSGSTVDPLSNSIADLRAEESTVVHSDDILGLSTESNPSKDEATLGVLAENKSISCENVTDCSLTSSTVETNLKGKDEIKSESKEVKIVTPSDAVVGETCDAVYSDHHVAEGAVNLQEKDHAEFHSALAQNDPSHGSNSVAVANASTNDVQVESSHVIQIANFSDVKVLQEKEETNVDATTLPTHDDRTDVPLPQSECDDFEDQKRVVSQNPSGLHSSESLKHDEDELKDTITEENNIIFNPSQLAEKGDVFSPDMHDVVDRSGSVNEELVNSELKAEEMHAEEDAEVSHVKLNVESSQRSDEFGAPFNAIESEMNQSHTVPSSEEQRSLDVENSQQLSLSETISVASSNENPGDASFCAVTSEATSVISIGNTSDHEKNRTDIDDEALAGKDRGPNLENDLETQTNDLQSNDLQQLEIKQSSDLSKSDGAGEMDRIENFDITNGQCGETTNNQIAIPVISEAVTDESAGNSTGIECTNKGPQSDSQEDIKEDETNRSVGTSADSHQAQDAEPLQVATEDPSGKYASLSSLSAVPSAQRDFAVEDNQDGQPGREVSGITSLHVQDQSGNNLVKHGSSGFDASVYSSSRCDSLEANWGSVSVLSMQSDAAAVIEAETSPSTGLAASTEAGETNLNNRKAASEKQQTKKSEMFEAPSFMTLVEPGHAASHKAPASESQKGKNLEQPSSTFPSLTQATSESQGRNKNEEIIAKVTNWSTTKEHTPLKSLLGEAANSNNPKLEENSANQKNGKVPESNGSGLTTVNSILGPESPSAQAAIGDAAKEWNSPARYPAEMKREKRKAKSRPYWIQLVCCSTVDLQRR